MEIWLISDTHFGHDALNLKFTHHDGTPARVDPRTGKRWQSTAECDERMVEQWNTLVRPEDHVYHLGDVAMKKEHLQTVKRLNGKKRLVMGNHDIFDVKVYREVGFEKIMASRVFDDLLLTHYPIHPLSIPDWCTANCHGHIHGNPSPEGRYFNLSVENIGYAPVSLTSLQKVLREKFASQMPHLQGG